MIEADRGAVVHMRKKSNVGPAMVRTPTNVTAFREGDRVIAWCSVDGRTWGSYADFVRVSARNVSPMAASLNFAQAAAVPIASLTAFQSLFYAEKGGMIPGQKVLINGTAGGVGSFAVQFAKSGGLLVAATCGTHNVAYVRSLGADRVIDYKTEEVCQAIRDWSAEGVDVVLDAVGPATLPQALDMLRPGGRLINIITTTAGGNIDGDQKGAERRGFRKIATVIDFDRARDSMREITHLIDAGLVHRGKLVLKVAELSA